MTESAMAEAPSIMKHGKGCWMKPGHHGCAIKWIRRCEYRNLIRAFTKRGEMIAAMTQKCAKLTQENQRLREKLAGLR